MNKVTNFAKQIQGYLTGDENQVIAAKNERKANSALKGTIAALEAKKVDAESAVEDAEEALKKAKYPSTVITSNESYIAGIKRADEFLTARKADQTDIEDSIAYWEGIVKEYNEEFETA